MIKVIQVSKHGSEEIYTKYIDAVVSTGLLKAVSATIDTPLRLSIQLRHNNSAETTTLSYLVKVMASMNKASGFSFGTFRSSAYGSNVIIPQSQYMEILRDCLTTSEEKTDAEIAALQIPIQTAYILLQNDSIDEHARSSISDVIYTGIDSDSTYTDMPDLIETVEDTVMVLDIFYIIFGVISIVLCFFVLWISFTANVRENGWEFGVLRSIGLTGWQTVRIYIYEALILVTSCAILGTIIGIGLAVVLTVQITLFSEMPFTYFFPTTLFVISIGLSLITAIFGSILAADDMRKKDIATVIRSGA